MRVQSGRDPATWGLQQGYRDTARRWRRVPRRSIDAILDSMGAGEDGRECPGPSPVLTVRLDQSMPEVGRGRLVLEDGGEVRVEGALPEDMPAGYHCWEGDGSPAVRLIATPGRCPLPAARVWGVAAQLYAARSEQSWGFGDLCDLRLLGEWAESLGGRFVLLNPLHAPAPRLDPEASPYFAGSRSFHNPLYISVEEVPGVASAPSVPAAAAAGRDLNTGRLIDRSRVWSLKSAALEEIFAAAPPGRDLEAYRESRGGLLERFATYCALDERHGPGWTSWPGELQHPANAAVRKFAASPEGSSRIRYHAWLQWLLDAQLAKAAAGGPTLINDFAVGVDPAGADSWMWPGVFARGVSVGAPPDTFNRVGQDWGVAPFDPWRLRDARYEPFMEAVRASFRHGGGVRIDHVMGLFRLFWIPAGIGPQGGGYVRYPYDDLLGIVALEAHRAGSFAVGEDLGTVQRRVRTEMRQRQVLRCKVWWLDDDPTTDWPEDALGSLGTHDLPTMAGFFSGADLEARRRLGLATDDEGWELLLGRLRAAAGKGTSVEDLVKGAHRDLARAPCLLIAASLDDLLGVKERPNVPGTVSGWPNWSLALPVPVEEFPRRRLPKAIARILDRRVEEGGPGGP